MPQKQHVFLAATLPPFQNGGRVSTGNSRELIKACQDLQWTHAANVTEMSEEIPVAIVENKGAGKLVAKAKPRPTPTLTLTPVSIPHRERKWTDIEPGQYSQGYFEVSKVMIRLVPHDDTVHREDDGAVRFD